MLDLAFWDYFLLLFIRVCVLLLLDLVSSVGLLCQEIG